jgi:predicted nucleic acid-binding protein
LRSCCVDTSVLVAIVSEERGSKALLRRLDDMDAVFGSSLLEAEFRAVTSRAGIWEEAAGQLENLRWILPERRLTGEVAEVLRHGRLSGADVLHLSTALYFFPEPGEVFFLTLDRRQAEVASKLGFRI